MGRIVQFIRNRPIVSLWEANGPNYLTLFRMTGALPLSVMVAAHYYGAALIMFGFLASLDLFDGRWARRAGLVTAWGTLADPLADKVLLCLAGLPLIFNSHAELLWCHFLLIFVREQGVTTLRGRLLRKAGVVQGAAMPGKIKMWIQSIGVCMEFLSLNLYGTSVLNGFWWSVVLITWVSAVPYFLAAAVARWPSLSAKCDWLQRERGSWRGLLPWHRATTSP